MKWRLSGEEESVVDLNERGDGRICYIYVVYD